MNIGNFGNTLNELKNELCWNYQNTRYSTKKLTQDHLLANVWMLSVSEGLMGAIHGDFHAIREVHFPELNYSFNIVDGQVHHILDSSKRYKYKKNRMYKDSQPKLLASISLNPTDAEFIRQMKESSVQLYGENSKNKLEALLIAINTVIDSSQNQTHASEAQR